MTYLRKEMAVCINCPVVSEHVYAFRSVVPPSSLEVFVNWSCESWCEVQEHSSVCFALQDRTVGMWRPARSYVIKPGKLYVCVCVSVCNITCNDQTQLILLSGCTDVLKDILFVVFEELFVYTHECSVLLPWNLWTDFRCRQMAFFRPSVLFSGLLPTLMWHVCLVSASLDFGL